MNIGSRIAAWFGRKKLPYLREVKRLISHGTEWMILEKYVGGMNVDIWLEDEYRYSVEGSVGAWNYGSRADTIRYQPTLNRGWQITSYLGGVTTNDTTKDFINVVIADGKVKILGVEYDFAGFSEYATGRFALFGCYNYNASHMSVDPRICSIGRTRIYDANGDVYNLIPVLDLNGRPCFYDEVSGEFFYNQGTGEFGYEELPVGGGYKCLISLLKSLWRRFSRVLRNPTEWRVAA